MADQAKFLSFLDMIDGGGAGKMGDKFEGGGIFSAIANMIAKPYGSEDEGRKRARMRALGLLDTQPAAATAPVGRIGDNAPKTVAPTKTVPTAPAPSYANMNMGEAGRGSMPPVNMSAVNRNYRIKGTYDPVGVTTVGDALDSLFDVRMPEGAHNPAYSIEKALIQRDIFNPKYPQYWDEQNQDLRYLMPPVQTAPAPQAALAPSGLLPKQAASNVAPNVSMSTDPMIGGTRNPSAYRPMAPMSEAQPSVDTSSFGLMPYEQFVPYITNLYKKEMGTNAMLSNDQLQSAYQAYRSSMGIGM